MSIADEIRRLNNAKVNIKQAIASKGVEVSDDALLDEYPALINSIPLEGGDSYYEELYNLRTSNGTKMDSLFARTSGVLDLSSLDTSNVTSMSYMFDYSSASVNIDGWDTSKVADMKYMFNYFTGSIDISKLDTSNVINAYYMFGYADTDKIILEGFSLPKYNSLSYMFYGAKGTTLDLSSWDISNITSMDNIFSDAKYTKIDLTGWNTSKVTNMSNMFGAYDNPLEKLIIPDWDMTNVTSSSNFFGYSANYIKNLKFVDLSRSNDATITKIASYLPTKTTTTYGDVLVPENTSQATFDALVAKYWRPLGAALAPVPTSIEIVAELDEIYPGKSTKVYLGTCEPWYADSRKVEIVMVSDNSIATIDEDNIVTSTGILGDIVLEARIKDTQEVVGTKTIAVSETDSYPNVVKFRITNMPPSYASVITVNNSGKSLSQLTYDPITDIYSYDDGAPITSVRFNSSSNINELVKLNTSNITDMRAMFDCCNKLTSLDLSNFDTSDVINMRYMFSNCNSLTTLDLSSFNTNNVTEMHSMFYCCYELTSLDLRNFDTSNVTDMRAMFDGCNNLRELRLDNCNKDTINNIITSDSFPADNNGTIYCKKSESKDKGLEAPGNWVFEFVEEEEIPLYNQGEFQDDIDIIVVRTMVTEEYDNLENMFSGCENLRSVNTQDWDVSNVTRMNSMFSRCNSLQELDLSSFKTSNVESMESMFSDCNNLQELDLSSFDTGNVNNMNNMFSRCNSLQELDLSSFKTSNVNNMSSMFSSCDNLQKLNLSSFDTSNVNSMESMFSGCNNLHTLRLDNFSTNSLGNNGMDESENIREMFAGCDKLQHLYLNNCEAQHIERMLCSEGFPTGRVWNEETGEDVTRKYYSKWHVPQPEGWEWVRIEEN